MGLAPFTSWTIFWRFFEEESAAEFFLRLRCPPPRISGLGDGDCWRSRVGPGESGGGRWSSSTAPDGPGGSCSSSSGELDEPRDGGLPSPAVFGRPTCGALAECSAWKHQIKSSEAAEIAYLVTMRGSLPSRARPILPFCPISLTCS